MVINDEQRFARPFSQNLLHRLLRHANRACKMNRIPFLARADVEEFDRGVFFQALSQFARGDLHLLVLRVARLEMLDHLLDVEIAIARAKLLQGFARLEGATAAAADMIALEESA